METKYYPAQQLDFKVLVRCFTYNQSKYIEDALNGFAMQQTNFPFVCLVMDDASTDGEQDVIKKWMECECVVDKAETIDIPTSVIIIVPHKNNSSCVFAFYLLKQNLYNIESQKMALVAPWREKCEYEAMCEGDDYWIDSLKLQKQVDFLDANPEYSFCCHRFSIYKQDCKQWLSEYADSFYTDGKNLEITLDLFFKTWITQPLTVVCRMEILKSIEREIMSYKYSRDVHLFYHLLKKGRGISLNDKMGVYRWHDGGVASSLTLVGKYKLAVNIYEELYLHTNDAKILEVYIKNGINLIKYSSWSTETFLLFRKLWSYTNDIKEKFILLSSLITPIPIVKFISTMRTLCSKLTKPFLCK